MRSTTTHSHAIAMVGGPGVTGCYCYPVRLRDPLTKKYRSVFFQRTRHGIILLRWPTPTRANHSSEFHFL